MEWLQDPAAWVGLLTLVVLEIVLGIDNLIFIAILADKLPPAQRDRARIVGLSLALLMRLGLLSVMSWLVTLTTPWFSVGPMSFSGRDLILMLGGLFLLFKGTMELHERIEGGQSLDTGGPRVYASFWVIVTQIVVLDAVFSLDSVITAVGMVDHLAIMMIAVIIAIGIMLLASKPLTRFVNAHPTVVVLCLGFLLMIGFSLLAESFGFKVPKGYLYAAIGFSVAIEALNQVARRNLLKLDAAPSDARAHRHGGAAHAGQAPARQRRIRPAQRHARRAGVRRGRAQHGQRRVDAGRAFHPVHHDAAHRCVVGQYR
ncbi:integral membrane protein TerC family protein [Bordetella pertussis STO1-CHOC-0017]|nr:integral membrane protein TerC family protein [Bordetella pertussis STO1-CHOC-0017]